MGTAVAGVFLGETGKLSGEVGVDSGAYSGSAAGEEDVNAHLMEGHERAEAHAAREQGSDAGLSEKLDGSEAAALLVGRVVHGGHVQDFSIFDFNDSVDITVTEVHAHFGIEATGETGRNCKKSFHNGLSFAGSCAGHVVWKVSAFAAGAAQREDFFPQITYLFRHRSIRFRDGETFGCGLGEGWIKGQGAYEGISRALAEFFEIACRFGIQVRTIDDDGHGDMEPGRNAGNAHKVLPAGEGRFGDGHGESRPAERADDGAADAGRAVTEYGLTAFFLRESPGLLLEKGDEFAGVFAAGQKLSVHEGAEAGAANVPSAAEPVLKIDGSGRAELCTYTAALAGQGVNAERPVFFLYGVEPAAALAGAAVLAVVLPDGGLGAADEIFGLYRFGPENDVHVRHVDIEIADDGVLREMGT